MMKKETQSKSVLLRSWRLVSPDRYLIISAMFCSFVASLCSVVSGYTLRILVDDVLPMKKLELLWPVQFLFIGAVLVQNCLDLLHTYQLDKVGQRAKKKLRDSMFHKLLTADYFSRLDKTSAKLISAFSYKIDALSEVLSDGIPGIVITVVDIVITLGIMFALNWKLTLLSIPIYPVLILASNFMQNKIARVQRSNQIKKEEMASIVSEAMECSSNIDNFRLLPFMSRQFSEKTGAVGKKALQLNMCYKFMSLFSWALIIVPYQAILYGVGGTWLITQGAPTIGLMLIFANFTNHLIQPVMGLISVSNSVGSARAAYEFLDEYMDSLPEKKIPVYAQPPEQVTAASEKLFYTYPGKEEACLKGISFEIRQSSTTVLWGSSGCGKSTLLGILSRQIPLNDPGMLCIDSRASMGYFPQTPHLFAMSLRDNFRLANGEITEEEMWGLLRQFAIDSVVARLPEGLETELLNSQGWFSLGEYRRLCLAVFCAGNFDVMLLDEPTASLDADHSDTIMKGLTRLNQEQGKTLIIASHDKKFLSIADKTVYLEA